MSPLPNAVEVSHEETKRRRPRLPELGSVKPLPSFAVNLAPLAVRDASAAYASALEALRVAGARVTTATHEVEGARWRDQDEARKATTKRRKPKPETTPDALAAVAEAERLIPAAEWGAREKLAAYLAAVRDNRDEIVEAAESRLRTVTGECKALVEQLEASLLRHDELALLVDELSRPGLGEGRHPVLNVRERSALGSERTEALAALRVNGEVGYR